MSKQELVPRQVPIIGRPDQVRNAIAAQVRAGMFVGDPRAVKVQELSGGRVAAYVTIKTAVPARRRAEDTTSAALGKALAFALVLIAVPLALIAAIVISGAATRVLGWLAVAAIIAVAVTWNRSNHAGACPGLHCQGCKH